jgi:hypothetical protein
MGASAIVRDNAARMTPGGAALPLLAPLLGMLPAEMQGRPMRPFFAPINVGTTGVGIAPGATGNGIFNADPNFDFAAFIANVRIRSFDNQTDRQNDPAVVALADTNQGVFNPFGAAGFFDIQTVFGTAGQPSIMVAPIIIPRSTGLILSVTNLHALNVNIFRFTLLGVQIS